MVFILKTVLLPFTGIVLSCLILKCATAKTSLNSSEIILFAICQVQGIVADILHCRISVFQGQTNARL